MGTNLPPIYGCDNCFFNVPTCIQSKYESSLFSYQLKRFNEYISQLTKTTFPRHTIYAYHYIILGLSSILSPLSPSLSNAANRIELLDPTHRGLHRYYSHYVLYCTLCTGQFSTESRRPCLSQILKQFVHKTMLLLKIVTEYSA